MLQSAFLIAWALADPIDPSAGELVKQLGDSRFAVRERASASLVKAGWPARRAIWLGMRSTDEETRSRSTQAWAKVTERETQKLAPFPFIDAQWYDCRKRSYCLVPNREMELCLAGAPHSPKGSPLYQRYREASRMWAERRLWVGTSPRLLRLSFSELHRRDQVFLGPSAKALWVDYQSYLRAGK